MQFHTVPRVTSSYKTLRNKVGTDLKKKIKNCFLRLINNDVFSAIRKI